MCSYDSSNLCYFASISFQSTITLLNMIKNPTTKSLTKGEEYFDLYKYVMTAAHCVACRTTDDTAVVLGENIVEVNLQQTNFVFLEKIFVYPDYVRGVEVDFRNNPDIALLKLEFPVNYGPKINAICLPSNPSSLYEGEIMVIAGWGVTESGEPSDKLLKADIKVIPNNDCKGRVQKKSYGIFHSHPLVTPPPPI